MSKVRVQSGSNKNLFASGTNCEDIPLFSPSAVPSQEQVLHSIFSPANVGRLKTMKSTYQNSASVSVGQNKVPTHSTSEQSAAPPKSLKNEARNNTTLDSTDLFFTPDARKTNQSTAHTRKTPHSMSFATNNEEFFSPAIFVPSARSGIDLAASPLSHISAGTVSSFKNFPIEMLSFDYVKNCRSVQDLEQVVTALSSPGNQTNYPSLLRTAKKQLHSIRNESFHSPASDLNRIVNNNATQTPKSLPAEEKSSERCHNVVLESILDDSLVMSFSSSVMDQLDTLDQTKPHKPMLQEGALAHLDQFPNDEAASHSHISKPELQNGRKSPEKTNQDELKNEIQQLQSAINEMTANQKKEKGLLETKIKSLEEAKASADQDIAILEETVASSAAKSEQLEMSLAQTRKESHAFEVDLQHERAEGEKRSLHHQEVMKEMRIKLNSLTLQLARSNDKQEKFRRELQSGSSSNQAEISSLKKSLEQNASNLEEMKNERYSFLYKIQESIGLHSCSKEDIDQMSSQSRSDLFDSITKKIASLQASSRALSEALAASENERLSSGEQRELTSRRYDKLKMSSRRLERDNLLLTKQIQDLTEDLTKGQSEIENLMKFSQVTRSEWDSRETEYRERIKKLESRKQPDSTTVSLALYRKAVDESKRRAEECEENRSKIKELLAQIKKLEKKLKTKRPETQATKLTKNGENNQKDYKAARQRVSQISSREGKLEAMMHNLTKERSSGQQDTLLDSSCKLQSKNQPLTEKADNASNRVRNNKVFPHNSKRDKLESMRRKMEKHRKVAQTDSPPISDENVNSQNLMHSLDTISREKTNVKGPPFVSPDDGTKTFDRKQMIRQAGGRKGLSDRVKQMRRISFKKVD